MIGFKPEQHQYFSLDGSDQKWLGVTTLISGLKTSFNKIEKAAKCSVRKPGKWPNKWYGHTPVEILEAWDNESKRSTELGKWYHNKREQELYIPQELNVYLPVYEDNIKIAPPQKLEVGIYPEHLCYLDSVGICGQADYVEVTPKLQINIRDYKTNKEIKTKGFTNWEGIVTKMLKPVQHLEECEFNTYALQLSLYLYIILRHNPMLTVGKLTIEHIQFEVDGEDKWGYPITKLDDNREPIVRDIIELEVPYLKSEVQSIIQWLKSK